MAKRKSEPNWPKDLKRPQLNLHRDTKTTVAVILFLVLAIILSVSLIGSGGSLGDILNKVLRLAFGWMAYGIPVVFLLVITALLRPDDRVDSNTVSTHAYVGSIFLVLAVTGALHLWVIRQDIDQVFEMAKQGLGGGYLGVLTSYFLIKVTNFGVAMVIMIAGILASIVVTFNLGLVSWFKRTREEPLEQQELKPKLKINNAAMAGFIKEQVNESNRAIRQEKLEPIVNLPEDTKFSRIKPVINAEDKNWKLPSLDLLEDSKNKVDSGNIEANVSIIQKTLNDFGIDVEMGEVNVGPTVTQYTFRPAVGVKLSQIAALQNDLALSLAASSVRMELPIPGKALVGIEIPNKTMALVRIKEIFGTSNFLESTSKLTFALGRDVAGHPMVSDLSRMPHLLIAGATGTGKSVAINSLLLSLLFRATPTEVKLVVIDPKRVELSLYNGLAHLLTPVIIDHEKAVNALKWTVAEMDRRFKLLSEVHKRNIGEYNSSSLIKLPFIVVVVDELADLMSVAQNDVEATIVRLAQMARAVGIHLVVATQRPSVDVITGLIKANITARMAFAVASQVDSRTILDMSGAEKLLGSGDLLYITAELPKPKRVQGTYVSEKEIKKVTDFLREQSGSVIYDQQILEKPQRQASAAGFESYDDEDELIYEAVAIVRAAGKASASLLQRRLRIGYARAARLLDILEDKGIVGPGEGAKPREVYGVLESEGSIENDSEELG